VDADARQETGKDELVLQGDDLEAITGIIAWIYGLYYDGNGSRSKTRKRTDEVGPQYVE